MAGNAKPNIKGLNEEASYSLIGYHSSLGGSGKGLFDGITSSIWGTSGMIWRTAGDYTGLDYVEIQINEKCNIWRCGSGDNCDRINILKYNGSTYDDVTSQYNQIVTNIDNTKWEKYVADLLPGQYKFVNNTKCGGYRIDTEWYIEKTIIRRYLIKQNNQYYSVKNSTLTLLGTPTDNTQKEKWFNDNGVDDLKVALLTKQSDGSKLIDKLDDKFQIRMMKSKE